jgi:hypothetical protein
MRVDGQIDKHTDMTKIYDIVDFRTNSPKKIPNRIVLSIPRI